MQITPSVRNNQDIAYGRDFQLHLQVGTFRSDKHRSHIQIHAVVILICTRHTCCKLRHTDDILDTDTIQLHTTVGASTVKKAANMRHIDSIITSLYITLANGSWLNDAYGKVSYTPAHMSFHSFTAIECLDRQIMVLTKHNTFLGHVLQLGLQAYIWNSDTHRSH